MGDTTVAAWAERARTLAWDTPFDATFVPDERHGRWFVGGRLNVAWNCVHRHAVARPKARAILWEGEPGDRVVVSYGELATQVGAAAAGLARLGVGPGDHVAIYTGLVPETVVALLACAQLGAIAAPLAPALPGAAVTERLVDIAPKALVTQDGAWRHGVVLPLKSRADEALSATGSVEHTVVVRRSGMDVAWFAGDMWFHDLTAPGARAAAAGAPGTTCAPRDAAAPLVVTYVADRRGRPTGVVHPTAGLLTVAATAHERVLATRDDAVVWAPMEFGWVGLLTHGILGPLCAGGTTVLFEGMLDTPTPRRAWEVVARYRVTTLVATPSVLRALRRWTPGEPPAEDTTSLDVLVTAGEAVEPSTLRWLDRTVGRGRAQVLDAWGQTELGGIVALDPAPPGWPDPRLDVVGPDGESLADGEPGDLVVRAPWPATAPAILGSPAATPGYDPQRAGVFVTGDLARRRGGASDAEVATRIEVLGRRDPVVTISGQLVSATEVAAVLAEHPYVARAIVGDRRARHGGRVLIAGVELCDGRAGPDLAADLRTHVHETLGGLAVPDQVVFVAALPDTGGGDPEATAVRLALRSVAALAGPATLVAAQEFAEAVAAVTARSGPSPWA